MAVGVAVQSSSCEVEMVVFWQEASVKWLRKPLGSCVAALATIGVCVCVAVDSSLIQWQRVGVNRGCSGGVEVRFTGAVMTGQYCGRSVRWLFGSELTRKSPGRRSLGNRAVLRRTLARFLAE